MSFLFRAEGATGPFRAQQESRLRAETTSSESDIVESGDRHASRVHRAEKHVAGQGDLADKFLVDFLLHGTHIRVKLPTGRTFMLAVQVTDTIANIKAMIEDKEGIPINKQRLVAELDDSSLLSGRTPLLHLLMLPVYYSRETLDV